MLDLVHALSLPQMAVSTRHDWSKNLGTKKHSQPAFSLAVLFHPFLAARRYQQAEFCWTIGPRHCTV
jgi:hypothetical protein